MKNLEELNREQFLRNIHSIPAWVKNGDDIINYCAHLQYRIAQKEAVEKYYLSLNKNADFTEAEHEKAYKISEWFDNAYNSITNVPNQYISYMEIVGS